MTAASSGQPGLPAWLWSVLGQRVFGLTFHNWYRFRNAMLRAWGATIEPTVRIRPSCRIDRPWNLSMDRKSALGDAVRVRADAPVTIGARSVISQFVALDAFRVDTNHPCSARTTPAPITIGHDVWIAAESCECGGQIVPDGALVGARSVVDGPVGAWSIASGDPAVSRRERPYQGRDEHTGDLSAKGGSGNAA